MFYSEFVNRQVDWFKSKNKSKRYFISIKYSESKKTTGPSGVTPIAVLKGESTIVEIRLRCI